MRTMGEFQVEVIKFTEAIKEAIEVGGLSWDEAVATVGFIDDEGKFVSAIDEEVKW